MQLSQSKKLYIFVAILLGGMVVALPFRQADSSNGRSSGIDDDDASHSSSGDLALSIGNLEGERATFDDRATHDPDAAGGFANSEPFTGMGQVRETELPSFQSDYRPLIEPNRLDPTMNSGRQNEHSFSTTEAGRPGQNGRTDGQGHSRQAPIRFEPIERSDATVRTPVNRLPDRTVPSSQDTQTVPDAVFTERRPPAVTGRRYRLRDGDTLPGIAARFLGDERRAHEILALNQDLIQHPEILPLNVEIVIPAR